MAEPNPSSFADFPEDVQFCILSFLTPTEIANFACTSKRFAPLCQNDSKLWYSLCDRRWGSKTQITKWGNGQISYKLLYKTLNKWENLIGFWRRCGQSRQKETVKPPGLVFFEWGPSFLSGWRVSPSQNGTYCVIKSPFLWMNISPEGQIMNYLDPEGQNDNKLCGVLGFLDMDLVAVNVNFIGDSHFSVEENMNFACRSLSSANLKGEDNGEDIACVESGSPGSLPETLEIYQYYANRMSPGADRALRKQRRREKEKQGKKRWETEHFLKIVDSSPTLDRPLQGLWKGICEDRKLEFYLVGYDGIGISCRRVGNLSERLSSSTPVFWTSDPTFIESPFPTEEQYIYDTRIHLQPPEAANSDWKLPLEKDAVSRIMYINSSYDLVIPGLEGGSANPWRVEGRIWQYRNGTFGFGFLRDHFIVDLNHIAKNGCLLDTLETFSD
ncbi:unnamed protein product [Dovyalis caffra]|uniref:F-box protein n=1 Tax=Dovyalis caffra TaxID=77055 RepID=A0AAV1S938_9ROSI|nr:unnamed protein product [Dovyalis caffra]